MRVKQMMVIVRIYQQIEMRISRLVILYQMPTYMPHVSDMTIEKTSFEIAIHITRCLKLHVSLQTDSPRSFDFEGVCA